jgi:DNA processing protein
MDGDDAPLQAEPRDVAALTLIPGLGIQGIRRILEHFRSLALVWQATPGEIGEVLKSAKVRSAGPVSQRISETGSRARQAGQRELERLAERRTSIVTVSDPRYPRSLLDARPVPYWLYVEGDADLLRFENHVAVVGTRRPTKWGTKTATEIAAWLAHRDITVVSGLAEGIDEAAQQACADAAARTIAVLGHGVNVTFPAATAALRQEIIKQGGAVVSEYLPNDRFDSSKFVQRNRIQAALSRAVIPVEAEYASGTAHTVRFASTYGRLLIGLKFNGMTPGITKLVKELGAPIVDLAEPDAHATMEKYLGLALGKSLDESFGAQKRAVLTRYADEFRGLTGRYELDQADVDFLFERLQAVLHERLDLGGDQGRSH